jgi:hypothetical protein
MIVTRFRPANSTRRRSPHPVQKNLKQFGLALHNYHDRHRTLPPGCVSLYDSNGNDTGPDWGWLSFLLPDMEQSAAWRQISFHT